MLVLTILLCTRVLAGTEEEGFVPLLKGSGLEGFHRVGGTGEYRREGDTVVGSGENIADNTFLRTDRTYKNFDLRFEYRLLAGNSGMMFRAQQKPGDNGRVFGYQCEHDDKIQRGWSGGLYDEARRKWLQPHSTDPRGQLAFTEQGRKVTKTEGWNEVRILCVKDDIKIWLNGELRVHFVDTDSENYTPEGFFGLQVHSGKKSHVMWRNLRIKELP